MATVGETTAPPLLTGPRALELLREVVAEQPDFVYERVPVEDLGPSCLYQFDGKPSCIVGQVLFRHGWSIGELAALDARRPLPAAHCLPSKLVDSDARAILNEAQGFQDSGVPWRSVLQAIVRPASMLV